jgi:hypothetical protein
MPTRSSCATPAKVVADALRGAVERNEMAVVVLLADAAAIAIRRFTHRRTDQRGA